MRHQIEAVIFDMDGTLLDTERTYARAWQRAVAEVGVAFPGGFYPTMIGCTRKDCERRIRESISHPRLFEAFLNSIPRHYQRIVEEEGVVLRPGVRNLLEWLAARGTILAVATSTARVIAVRKLHRAGIDRYFDFLTAGDEVNHGKPAPDIFEECLRRLGRTASRCLVVEDSPNGVRAAVAAGLRTVLVPDIAPIPPDIGKLTWGCCDRIDEVAVLIGERLAASAP